MWVLKTYAFCKGQNSQKPILFIGFLEVPWNYLTRSRVRRLPHNSIGYGNGTYTSDSCVKLVGDRFGKFQRHGVLEDCPIVRFLGQMVSSGKPFIWLPNELPYFAMSSGDVQISAEKCKLHYVDRVDDFVPIFKEQLQFSKGLAGEVADPVPPAHPLGRPAQVDPDVPDHSSDGDDEGEEPIDRMRRLVAEESSMPHVSQEGEKV